MVTTRSAGASEPLEMLHTPPKKPRKTRIPKKPISLVRSPKEEPPTVQELTPPPEPGSAPELRVTSKSCRRVFPHPGAAQISRTSPCLQITQKLQLPRASQQTAPCTVEDKIFFLAPEHIEQIDMNTVMDANQNESLESSPPNASTSKRRRSEDESQDENTIPKRARTETPSHSRSKETEMKFDMLFMFPKKDLSDDEEELSRSAPPKSYADMIRRDRRLKSLKKKNNPFGLSPRRPLARLNGQNPFGIETLTPQELDDSQSVNTDTPPPSEQLHRDERSAAPEPETPKPRGLFGSLRNLGSATIGRAQSLLGNFTPRSGSDTPEPVSHPIPQARTEPRRRNLRPVWEIEYPQLPPETPVSTEEQETESEKKRKAYEAVWGKTNRDYDHLHTESIDGNPENLPYPIKKKPPPAPPVNEDDLDPATRAFRQERKKKNLERYGLPRPKILPDTAPLFGPDSHYARRTVDPRSKELEQTGFLPIDKENLHLNRKRKAAAVSASTDNQTSVSEQTKPRTFQPYMEDEMNDDGVSEDGPSTPAMKKQKLAHQMPQTPRSAMKVPGSIGRSGRSVMFNANPVASVKRMTPPTINPAPAGTYDPNSLFKTFADEARDRRDGFVEDSPSSVGSLDPSPNTRANTLFNARTHPGDALTNAINDANPKKIDYVWHDPTNPDWRPSLANPQPGTFRFVPEDEEDYEEDMLAELEREETAKAAVRDSATPEAEAPQPPSTPRMSHAELPKAPGSTQATSAAASAAANASALEAANLERRRAEAAKTRPKTSSRLAEVTSARSRSPSPPGLDTDLTDAESPSPTDSAAKTPSPQLEQGSWTWTDETNEYISSNPSLPDFAYNDQGELVASFALKSSAGTYDDKIKGPDDMTERERQTHYAKKYNDEWARNRFQFDAPMTYEQAGCGSKYIHDLIRTNDARHPEVVRRCDRRFAEEWDAHAEAINNAQKQKKRLVATFPGRDGVDMLDVDED